MKKQHSYPSIEQIRESLQNLPPESKAKSDKEFLQQEDLKMPPNKLGYDTFDGLLASNYAGDIASFRF